MFAALAFCASISVFSVSLLAFPSVIKIIIWGVLDRPPTDWSNMGITFLMPSAIFVSPPPSSKLNMAVFKAALFMYRFKLMALPTKALLLKSITPILVRFSETGNASAIVAAKFFTRSQLAYPLLPETMLVD